MTPLDMVLFMTAVIIVDDPADVGSELGEVKIPVTDTLVT